MDLPLSNNGLTLTDELVRYQLGNKFKNNSSAVGFVLRQINFTLSDFWTIFEFIDWFESRNMSQWIVEDEMSFIKSFLTECDGNSVTQGTNNATYLRFLDSGKWLHC